MELTEKEYDLISDYFPKPRGKSNISNLSVLNAVIYVAENGCKWRSLPERFGNWHTVYMRLSRWSKSGLLGRVFEQLQAKQIIRVRIEIVLVGSDTGGSKAILKDKGNAKNGRKKHIDNIFANSHWNPAMDEQLKFIWLPQVGSSRH